MELRERIYRILKRSETAETEPPFKILPVSSEDALTLKVDAILSLPELQRVQGKCTYTLHSSRTDGLKAGCCEYRVGFFQLSIFKFCPFCGKEVDSSTKSRFQSNEMTTPTIQEGI